MKIPPTHDKDPDDDDRGVIFGTHPGDLAVVVIAAMITLGFLYLLLGPSPFAGLYQQAKKTRPAAAKIGPKPETQMMLYDARKPQKP
jgi:hypothetical protein